jgi:hypothetical protein
MQRTEGIKATMADVVAARKTKLTNILLVSL